MAEDSRKLTRRLFLQQSAKATAMAATFYSVAMKSDGLDRAHNVQAQEQGGGGSHSYQYM